MKNILAIFRRDLKKICTNSMAIVLAIGIAVLPSLYAWFNIYANWDPYGSTGNMKVAVIIEDEGFRYKDIDINVGQQIETNLKANDVIDWQFVDRDTAVSGIEAGEYYAGIEIPSGFSQSLTSIVTSDFKQPQITYYANEKKNAIATKITDKVVQTVQQEVNESFVETVVNLVNNLLGTVVTEANKEGSGMFATLKTQILSAKDSIAAVEATVDSFAKVMEITQGLNKAVSSEDVKNLLENTDKTIQSTEDVITVTKASVESVTGTIDTATSDTAKKLDEAADRLEKLGNASTEIVVAELTKVAETASAAENALSLASQALRTVNDSLPEPLDAINDVASTLETQAENLGKLSDDITSAIAEGNASKAIASTVSTLHKISSDLTGATETYKSDIKPVIENNINSLVEVLADVSNLINALEGDMPQVNELVKTLNASMESGDDMLTALSTLLSSSKQQLDNLYKKLDGLGDSEIVNTILNLTEGNSDELGEFLACPVKIDTQKIYGIETYGSAMAPFYSTLAIWVGAIILVAILKPNVKNKKEIGSVTPFQEYMGRGFTFMFIAMIQGFIICIGDLLFLKIQCYHPVKFVFAGVFASFVFSFFIYSLVAAFGDVGKAIAVIFLVLQIGGSGGTFPIDVTPKLFININPYLPFTFVIEAMRECVCGLYQNNYWLFLLKLCSYIVIGFVLGTLFRFLFKNLIKFFSKRIEETGLM
ncbi:MAG: YhgE/Pip domain-containing protein [Eubacterium sp.]|nr:YhgE/Pip domain-containing protein [Eubacterium sp.]